MLLECQSSNPLSLLSPATVTIYRGLILFFPPAHADWLLALLQGFDSEEEGGGDGGGEEAAAARGGEDGRWCRVCQVCHLMPFSK